MKEITKEVLEYIVLKDIEGIVSLTEKEVAVLQGRSEGKTLEEIGKGYRITREAIRQIEERAKEKVMAQHIIVDKIVKDILDYTK